jgi:hypothetical protein
MDKIVEEEKKESRPPLNKKIVIGGRQGASTAMMAGKGVSMQQPNQRSAASMS